jgi:hypothetical protein
LVSIKIGQENSSGWRIPIRFQFGEKGVNPAAQLEDDPPGFLLFGSFEDPLRRGGVRHGLTIN